MLKVLCMYFEAILYVLCKYVAGIWHAFRRYSISILQFLLLAFCMYYEGILCKYFEAILQLSCKCFGDTLHVFSRYVASVLQVCWMYSAGLLHMICYGYGIGICDGQGPLNLSWLWHWCFDPLWGYVRVKDGLNYCANRLAVSVRKGIWITSDPQPPKVFFRPVEALAGPLTCGSSQIGFRLAPLGFQS